MAVVAVPHPAYPLDADAAGRAARTLSTLDDLTPDAVAALA